MARTIWRRVLESIYTAPAGAALRRVIPTEAPAIPSRRGLFGSAVDAAVALDSFLWLAGIRQLPAIKSHRRTRPSQRRLNNLSGREPERRNGQSSPLLSGLIVRMVCVWHPSQTKVTSTSPFENATGFRSMAFIG